MSVTTNASRKQCQQQESLESLESACIATPNAEGGRRPRDSIAVSRSMPSTWPSRRAGAAKVLGRSIVAPHAAKRRRREVGRVRRGFAIQRPRLRPCSRVTLLDTRFERLLVVRGTDVRAEERAAVRPPFFVKAALASWLDELRISTCGTLFGMPPKPSTDRQPMRHSALFACVCMSLGLAACRRPHPHGVRRGPLADPCAQGRVDVRRARAEAKQGYLERALVLLDQAEELCRGLGQENARLRADWLIDGQMQTLAQRWVNEVQARTDRDSDEVAQSARALAGMFDARPGAEWMKAGDAAMARSDVVLARTIYTRAIYAFERDGEELAFESHFDNSPLLPRLRKVWAFSPQAEFFVDGKSCDPSIYPSRLTLWGLEQDGPHTLELKDANGCSEISEVAVSRKGIVLFRQVDIWEWNPFTGSLRVLGYAPNGAMLGPAKPGETPLGFSSDGGLVVWDTVLHHFGTSDLVSIPKEAMALALSPDGRALTVASSTHVAEYSVPESLVGPDGSVPRLEPQSVFPIADPLVPIVEASPPPATDDVALSHDAKWLLTSDGSVMRLHSIDRVEGVHAVDSKVLRHPVVSPHQGHALRGRLQFSGSDRWVLVQDLNGDRVLPIGDLGARSCIEGLRETMGFVSLAGREWVVTGWGSTWRLGGLPLKARYCGEPVPTLDITRLDKASHGRDALEIIAKLPCRNTLSCPPSGFRTLLEIRWIKNRRRREGWLSSHYGCHAGDKPLPWFVCALRFESEDIFGAISASATAEAIQP